MTHDTAPANGPSAQNAEGTPAIIDEWAIVEIMGMRKHAGRIMEVERFGSKMLRVDVPVLVSEQLSLLDRDKLATRMPISGAWVERWVTHFYGGGAIFGITPTDEQTVMAANRTDYPVGRYLPRREEHDDGPDDDPF